MSDEPKKEYGPKCDEWAAIQGGLAERCQDCKKTILKQYLSVMRLCPECSPVKRNYEHC